MISKNRGRDLVTQEQDRDIGQELLDAVDEIRAGGGRRYLVEPRTAAARARSKTGLSQARFAALLGVSRRTLEQWEQGRREPSGAARTLIRIAELRPEILHEIEG
ncbi:MAG TPA: helix-turn-helix domain-containing protein [Syntrophobacteraceae bacterium]|nr:helix-turn-helix domain-containing protein [Syntrophobacteraceae bacterium]